MATVLKLDVAPKKLGRILPAGALALAAVLSASALAPVSAIAGEVTHLAIASSQIGRDQNLELGVNKSVIIDLPVDAHEVIVSQPSIATAIMRTKRRAIVQGTGVGETNIFFLDVNGRRISVVNASVVNDASTLASAIAQTTPDSHIRVESFGERVVLSGTAKSTDDVNKAMAIAAQFTGDAKMVGNVVTVTGVQQVKLKVTVAEVNSQSIKQLGIDFNASYSAGSVTTSLINNAASTLGSTTSASGTAPIGTAKAGIDIGGLSIDATLKALERRDALRTLAEPTLTAISGQSAHFVAGGELPYVVTTSNGTQTTFKEYGVILDFTPTVKSNGIISLDVDTQVSDPKSDGSIQKRQAKSTVELAPGSTLAIGGLMQQKDVQQINQLPGIGNIPILGALFRSRDFISSKTELLVLVTPYLAEAGPAPTLPTDNVVFAGDAETIFLGHMQKLYGVGNDGSTPPGQYQGSVGFVLD